MTPKVLIFGQLIREMTINFVGLATRRIDTATEVIFEAYASACFERKQE